MKKLILLFAAAALLSSAAFADGMDNTLKYHEISNEDYFRMISYEADAIGALSVGIRAMNGGIDPFTGMHWTEGSDSYGDYLLGTSNGVDSLTSGAPAMYFSDYGGEMDVDGVAVNKPALSAVVGLPLSCGTFEVWLTNTSDTPLILNGDIVFTAAIEYEPGSWSEDIPLTCVEFLPCHTDSDVWYMLDSTWAEDEPIEVDMANLPPDEHDPAGLYTEKYTDYVLAPGESLWWLFSNLGFNDDNYFTMGFILDVSKEGGEEPAEVPEPAAFAYALVGLVPLARFKRRAEK
ncbi:MAG: hypothetical protein J6X38_07850 [Abditibacteriota bacterium]|nr:hypothetical protein [Abditibacteriota bacterium]